MIALVIATSIEDVRLPAEISTVLSGGSDSALCLDHIGIAVRSIEAAQLFYRVLGARLGGLEQVPHEGVRVAMVQVGATRLELLEPLSPESVIGRFLERRGEGLHHIAILVDDIHAKFERCVAAGMRLASDAIRVGAGGHRYFFVHPSSAAGVLVEVVGDKPPQGVD